MDTKGIDNIVNGFSADSRARLGGSGHTRNRPIFVVGWPRSGTTLTEQVLASHSAIHGAGELAFINKTFSK